MSSPEASTLDQDSPRSFRAGSEGSSNGSPAEGWHRKPPEVPRSLVRLSQERARAESEIATRLKTRTEAADRAIREGTRVVEARRDSESAEARDTHQKARTEAIQTYETDSNQTRESAEAERSAIMQKVRDDRSAARHLHEQTRWEAGTVFEASDQGELQRQEEWVKALAAEEDDLVGLRSEAEALLAAYRKYRPHLPEIPPETSEVENPYEALRSSIVEVVERLHSVAMLKWPRSLAGGNVAWLFILPWLILSGPMVYALGMTFGLIASTVAAVAVGFGLRAWLYGIARRSLELELPPLLSALARAENLMPRSRTWAEENHKRRRQEILQKRDEELRRADRVFATSTQQVEDYQTNSLRQLDENTARRLLEIEQRRDRALSDADQALEARLAGIHAQYQSDSTRLQENFEREKRETQERHEADWSALVERWGGGLQRAAQIVDEVEAESARRHLDWNEPGRRWTAPTEVPPAVRFGSAHVNLAHVAHGIARNESLRQMARPNYDLPALLTFPDRGSLLIEAPSEGRDASIKALQGAMLRFLTSLPPGKVRFTIIDPVGLGRNFAAFMHLADYSELLVTSRIWTEPQQIENRLADVSLHMEKVIQQFLRNEYPTLEEYNAHAGEVAEPYRIIVVADFPSGFNDQSAQRLMSIATSGARCGVYTLIGLDTSVP
ncbi:MAG TPA: hypothetical protein VFT74_12995, partial [Isosphaeraceae bacterium]|nr:hypothetical protein [Isosphaeraceae bacterium]